MTEARAARRTLRGVVLSEKGRQTITVLVVRRFAHPKYGKMISRRRKVHAHDPREEAHVGDTVEIVECRPMSRTKRFRLARVVTRNPEAAVVTETPAPEQTTA
jgi:small subunit ribosomal protein S17